MVMLACGGASNASAAQIDGEARASDGHTLIVRGTRIALLDATPFASTEACGPDAATWPCGDVSLHALQAAVAGRHITCDLVNKVGHGDFQGHCTTPDGADIAASLVASGWERASGPALDSQQQTAKSGGKGAWGARGTP